MEDRKTTRRKRRAMRRRWSRITTALLVVWGLATVWHMFAENWTAAVTSSLMFAAIMLIVSAVRSRARKSMYPSG